MALTTLSRACLAGLLLALLSSPTANAKPLEQRLGAPELYAQLQAPRLDPDRAISVDGLELSFGDARLFVETGVVVPTEPVQGRTVEWVFIGEARFRFAPPDEIEADQLELFAGQRELDVTLDSAVMVQADDSVIAALLEQRTPTELTGSMLAEASRVHQNWIDGAERLATGIRGGVFNALIGDRAFAEYFAIWCSSYEIGSFIYEYDPEDTEPHTLAHFSPIEIRGWDRLRLERHLRHQQRKGRWLGTRIQDLGNWDIWLSGPWDPTGEAGQAALGFETDHYELDVQIDRHDSSLRGKARLSIRAEEAGRRVIPLELYRDLQVASVVDGEGRDLFFFRSGGDLMVLLERPTVVGQQIELELAYGGHVIRWVDRKTFDLEHTSDWYPHCGTVDRATYDVTLRWPRKLSLIASGRVVDSGRDGRYRWERRRLDEPAIAFSFAMGSFLVERSYAGHVELEVAFNRTGQSRQSAGARREVVETVRRVLDYFEEAFGPYPLDRLTVVMLPRRYSQSFLGFITLTDSILPPNNPPSGSDMEWYRATTIAHEIAHQWWGNLIGWSSYRDQWLSEAMANYSALRYWADTEEDGAAFLARMSAGWRESLSQPTPTGRTVESLGPIVLGIRLNSSLANNAYRAIVYRKGAAVLAMLARAVGPRRFSEMMRSLVEVASHRIVSTAAFVQSVERMSGLDLGGFARRYIYGTGIPEVYYRYEVTGDEASGFAVRGEARLVAEANYKQVVRRTADGHWNVDREAKLKPPARDSALMVPFRMRVDDGVNATQLGSLMLRGERDEFEISSARRPLGFTLDPRGEILATFYSERTEPKRVAILHAKERWISGDLEAAEQGYRAALSVHDEPSPAGSPRAMMRSERMRYERQDPQIRLHLARLALERDDQAAVRVELGEAARILGPDSYAMRIERAALEGRIELINGDYAAAYKRSKKALRLTSPRRQRRFWRLGSWQASVGSDWLATNEVLAVLAVAAFETGHREEFRWALEAARERGVDLAALEAQVAERGGTEAAGF